MSVRVSVPFVMDGKIHAHSFGNKLLIAEIPDKGGVLVGRYLSGDGKHPPPCKLGVPLLLDSFGGVPQSIAVCIRWWGVGRQHDFCMDNLAFMGIVFLLLVVLGKQPFPTLVGGRRNG